MNLNKTMNLESKDFYKKVFILVIPMAIQNLINVGVNATDVIMLGKVGEDILAGCSLAGQVFFILSLFLFGMASGASVLTAQYWGKGDRKAIEKIMGIVLGFSLLAGLLFMFITLLFTEQIMGLFTKDANVIAEGSTYLKIVAYTFPMVAFSMSYLNMIRSIEKVVISTVVYGISLILNFIINYILIFGQFGIEPMGIKGAAIGTLCARFFEVVVVLLYGNFKLKEVGIVPKYMIFMDKILLKDFMKFSGPVIFNEILWGVGYSVNAAIIGHLGSNAVAANSVAHISRQLSMVVVFGMANATAIMLGKAIGENNISLAMEYGKKSIRMALVGGLLGGLLILCLRPVILTIMGFEGITATYTNIFLFMMSYYVVGQALNSMWIVGIFRAGGDTLFGMILDMTTMWFGSILLGAIAAFVLKLPIPVVYFILLSDELIKTPLSLLRYKKKKWLRNVTREII